ncbi:MAG: hypothetical protein CMJ24_04170 [Phycisphaerae bacterium]|nr:hypothetical protein [Phycisphaerae bacterium]|tara:strand:+ start:750 stop:2186 length:1437 start_codon:yes stop_codon:yes gene_type:complete
MTAPFCRVPLFTCTTLIALTAFAVAMPKSSPANHAAADAAPSFAGVGADIITGTIAEDNGAFDMQYYGTSGGVAGYAFATQACNIGSQESEWIGGTNQTPVIVQNCYQYRDGIFRQVGLSWLKHSFCALSESESYCGTCVDNFDCDYLAAGCADTYFAGLNGDATAPRTQINPSTGSYDYPFTIFPSGAFDLRGKLQVKVQDTDPSLNPGARWAIEGYYMSTDDAQFDNHMNNASWREITFTAPTTPSPVGGTNRQDPAIYAWDAMEPGGITIDVLDTPEAAGAGRVYVGSKATALGGGWWHYQYAIQNLNSHRGIDGFSIPVPDCVQIENIGFTDVPYHSGEGVAGTDWPVTRSNGAISWNTDSFEDDPNANAIRWSTMYTFGFDADAPPTDDTADLSLWRTGTIESIEGDVRSPNNDCEVLCASDINADLLVNVNDLLIVIANWGTTGNHYADISGDQVVGVDDLLRVISFWGACP